MDCVAPKIAVSTLSTTRARAQAMETTKSGREKQPSFIYPATMDGSHVSVQILKGNQDGKDGAQSSDENP